MSYYALYNEYCRVDKEIIIQDLYKCICENDCANELLDQMREETRNRLIKMSDETSDEMNEMRDRLNSKIVKLRKETDSQQSTIEYLNSFCVELLLDSVFPKDLSRMIHKYIY